MAANYFLSGRQTGSLTGALLLLFSVFASATTKNDNNELATQIAALLNARHANKGITQTVTIKNPQIFQAACTTPRLTLPDTNRLTGNMSVGVQCERKRFVQVEVSAEGSYWIAARTILPGETIDKQAIHLRRGSLNGLPASLVFAAEDITGSVAIRTVNSGQPVQHNQLRKQWRIKSGETVDVIIHGKGFQIRSRGKAMTNAAVNDTLRVRMNSGKLVSGIVDKKGIINII